MDVIVIGNVIDAVIVAALVNRNDTVVVAVDDHGYRATTAKATVSFRFTSAITSTGAITPTATITTTGNGRYLSPAGAAVGALPPAHSK